jgi:hypothetical protein
VTDPKDPGRRLGELLAADIGNEPSSRRAPAPQKTNEPPREGSRGQWKDGTPKIFRDGRWVTDRLQQLRDKLDLERAASGDGRYVREHSAELDELIAAEWEEGKRVTETPQYTQAEYEANRDRIIREERLAQVKEQIAALTATAEVLERDPAEEAEAFRQEQKQQ